MHSSRQVKPSQRVARNKTPSRRISTRVRNQSAPTTNQQHLKTRRSSSTHVPSARKMATTPNQHFDVCLCAYYNFYFHYPSDFMSFTKKPKQSSHHVMLSSFLFSSPFIISLIPSYS